MDLACRASCTYVIMQAPGLLFLGPLPPLSCMGHVSGQWLMQHVEPRETTALCPCVSLPGGLQYCRSMPYKPFPCSLSEQTCKQLRFPSEVVSGEVLFFLPLSSWGGGGGYRIWGIGRQGCRWKWDVPLTQRYGPCTRLLATKSWIMQTEDLLRVEAT